MIWIVSLLLCGTLCNAQNTLLWPFSSSGAASSFSQTPGVGSQASSSSGIGSPFTQGSASAVAGSAQAGAFASAGTPGYASCVRSQPDTAVKSHSKFSYSLLESTFTNPALKDFYSTSLNADDFYQAIYNDLKGTWKEWARSIAGSMTLLMGQSVSRVTPLVNAVVITNAISTFMANQVVITTENFDDYVDDFINAVSKGLRNEDGSSKSDAVAVATTLLNYLSEHSELTYKSLHQFISILAGQYRCALYSNCKPSTFEEIISP